VLAWGRGAVMGRWGGCVVLLLAGRAAGQATLDADAAVTVAELSPWMGRGAGLEDANHEITGGLWSQLVWGESFEEPPDADGVSSRGTDPSPGADLTWVASGPRSGGCSWSVAAGDAQTGVQSQQIRGAGCGVMNRGADAMGMAFEPSRDYNGFVFARLPAELQSLRAQTLDLEFRLLRLAGNATAGTVASTRVSVPADALRAWTMVNFTLRTGPNASVGCFEDAHPASPCDGDVAEKQCYSCRGAFSITLLSGEHDRFLQTALLAGVRFHSECIRPHGAAGHGLPRPWQLGPVPRPARAEGRRRAVHADAQLHRPALRRLDVQRR